MSDDGLSESEKVNLLFKNYMNFISTSDFKEFYQETALSNNTNIFSSNILSNLPPKDPSYVNVNHVDELKNYLIYSGLTDISINQHWWNSKTGDRSDGFKVNSKSDADRTVLRLTQIKLDYVGLGSSAFICKDNEGRNILQNLIPFNYSTDGYSLVLNYNNGTDFMNVRWTISKSLVSAELGEPVDFGGALFDSKNGIITFYDVSGGDDQ